MKSILDIEVSCFAYYNEVNHPKTVNLLAWLTSTKYKDKVDLIRSLDDKKERGLLKSKLPAITPSAILKNRISEIPLNEKLIKHTGFIQIDIDLAKGNIEISNWNDLKDEISKLPQIAYFGLSASGKGYWGLIPIPPDPDNHSGYFDTLHGIFLHQWGIELDGLPKNITSLRGYSYDLDAYFNHEAKTFTVLKKPVTVAKIPPKINPAPVTDGKYQWIENWILSKISEAMPGDRHNARLKYSRLAGGLIAGGYLPASVEQSIIDSYLSQYGNEDTKEIQDREIEAVKYGIAEGIKAPATPPPIRCLFVAFTDIKDYSDKAFKIWQGDDKFYIPKSTVFEILDFGFYVLEYYLKKERKKDDRKPPAYQSTAWKEFPFDADPIHQIIEKKTLIHDDYQTEFDSTEAEIRETEKRNQRLRSDIERIKQESQGMESLFIQVATLVKWEWIEPGCIKEPQGKDRLFRLKYYTT
ncbi:MULTISPECIES: BT4734/BF3469 family protein [Cecembia]|uniref:VirE-like protein n=2 Tax=Cecembia TaxID=1187078 RepID=A0A4Q7P799_9BACT|nr:MULTISPECIES: BT4734/BF3469 family protein [Cecembia]PSL03026.1 VirE-like protein [Cecembia rubra]RZS95350.1 VirE-like protein [Cecembia calidifontis]